MDQLDKVLLSPKSLIENGFHQNDATLESVVQVLKTQAQYRSSKQLAVLNAITKNIKFFVQKSNELGMNIHVDACKVMSYEFFKCDEVRDR
jgi:hypothetical protein